MPKPKLHVVEANNARNPKAFAYYFAYALASEKVSFYFDRDRLKGSDVKLQESLDKACTDYQRHHYEFNGQDFSENTMLQVFGVHPEESRSHLSNYRILSDWMESQSEGVIVIHAAQLLTLEGVHILSRLISFSKRKKLNWQYFFVTSGSSSDNLLFAQLFIDEVFPDLGKSEDKPTFLTADRLDLRADRSPFKKPILGLLSVTLLIAVIFGVNIWLQNYNKEEKIAPQRPLAEASIDLSPERLSELEQEKMNSEVVMEAMEEEKSRDLKLEKTLTQIENERKKKEEAERRRLQRAKPPPPRMSAALARSVEIGALPRVKSLYELGEAKNAVNGAGETAIIIASRTNSAEMITWLLGAGANVNSADERGRTPIFYASVSGDLEVVKTLLSFGANPDVRSKLNKTPLMAAVHNDHLEVANALLAEGVKVNVRDHSGWSAIFYAAWNNNIEIAQMLLKAGANAAQRDNRGQTAISIAKMRNNDELGEALLASRLVN